MGTLIKFPAGSNKLDADTLVMQYIELRNQKKTIEDRMKVLSDDIKSCAETLGTKDDKGSYYFECNDYMVGKQARKRIDFDLPKAIKLFRRKGVPECIDTVEVINRDAVEQALVDGSISMEDLEKITTSDVSYVISVAKKDEIVEAQVAKVAACRKPKFKRKK